VLARRAATGTPALLDTLSVVKPDISDRVKVKLKAPEHVSPGDSIAVSFSFKNDSPYALNGAQVVVSLPDSVSFDFASVGTATVHGRDVVVSLGRTVSKQHVEAEIHGHVSHSVGSELSTEGLLRSGTALAVVAEPRRRESKTSRIRRARVSRPAASGQPEPVECSASCRGADMDRRHRSKTRGIGPSTIGSRGDRRGRAVRVRRVASSRWRCSESQRRRVRKPAGRLPVVSGRRQSAAVVAGVVRDPSTDHQS